MFGKAQIIDQSQSLEQDEFDVVNEEEEEPEAMVDQMVNLQLSEIYKVVNLFGIYNNNFLVVASDDYWPTYRGDTIYHNKNMRRNKKGPSPPPPPLQSTQIRTEMDTTEKIERLCGICRLPGHTRKRCPNVGASSR
ncbi:unnamed protein product [Lathyrus sativus]|nr:unnamed protein product [Lathyrus sativus]